MCWMKEWKSARSSTEKLEVVFGGTVTESGMVLRGQKEVKCFPFRRKSSAKKTLSFKWEFLPKRHLQCTPKDADALSYTYMT